MTNITSGRQQDIRHNVAEFQIYRSLNSSRDFAEFNKLIGQYLRSFGFDEHAFGRVHTEGKINTPSRTTSTEMREIYYEEGLFEHSLIDQFVRNNSKPIFQSEIENNFNTISFSTDFTKTNVRVFELFKQFGYNDFYIMPGKASNGHGNIVLSVTHRDMERPEFRKKVEQAKHGLHSLLAAIDYVGTKKFPNFFLSEEESPDIIISPRPLEILTLMAQEDMSLQETADHLGRSVHTLNQQVAAARRAFGVDTTIGAVYQAIREGLIVCDKKTSASRS
ncbi:helix-turn-helix transcriptional regulator [Eilatimonas milleporae]|uniref:Autoinducer binding domain-containing protein n=1 Tax=Eilatimonas milleporae TaxID=911205 RepID=A0A3M0CJ26_9PROT|nr:autoinducer binding domain-containing protein [Eilatimonas milleporae]RMB08777.1 autoinducer binding domain-containing protein [Eilatimonas milleporae]